MMARGVPSPAPAPALPKVSFVKVEDDASTEPVGVHDLQARSYGYNDFSPFHRPEPYIRYIEPLESELAVQVEYDMDEQDQEWLDAVNNERRHDQLDKVTYETFEIIMDRLEKEWFNLTKNIPKPDMALPSEDSTCAICDDAEGENSNAIVFCDGCNLAVHQDCYGVPYIPEGQWLCRKCTVSPEIPVSCILCPNEGGAFKQTIHGEWAHLLCAIWVPETRVANDVFMEPITGVDRINKQRWKLKCSICGIREGACIQCSKASCFLAFHATCARREKLLMPMKSAQGAEPATLACYCEKHLPKEQLAAHQEALAELESDVVPINANIHTPRSSKKARAYAKTYKLGPPLVPALIVHKIMDYIGKVTIRKKLDFVQLVCRYWSLKREARRGAPLLKRLHLEPWTASAANKQQTDEEKAMKLEHLKRLRKDLETVRMLAELSRKREIQKLKQSQIIQELLSTCLFPHEPRLRLAFERIMGMDRHDYFKNPVSRTEVPDYFDIVKNPMCWNTIDSKLDARQYWDVRTFQNDVNLVLGNAMTYNKHDTPIYKVAQKMLSSTQPILRELDQLSRHPRKVVQDVDSDCTAEVAQDNNVNEIGDLEPPLNVTELLLSQDAIKDNVEFILEADPLTFLLSYEFGTLKPPPPPPPPRPKRVRDRKAEKERKASRGETNSALDGSPGFRAPILSGPRTRSARAAAAAFEAEAGATAESAPDVQLESPDDSEDRASRNGKKWRRAPLVLPGHADIPPVVDDVDNQRSFKMFDEGWILPASQRRGGRAPIEKHALPPPKKRIRTERHKSQLSVFSTPASENQTLQEVTPEGYTASNITGDGFSMPQLSETMDAAESSLRASYEGVKRETDPSAYLGLHHEFTPSGVVVIEELDTPATRRAKAIARKERKLAEQATLSLQPFAGPSQAAESGDALELSSLSSLGDSDGEHEEKQLRLTPVKKAPPSSSQIQQTQGPRVGSVMLKGGDKLEGGTLVWAKADTYPWWAAVIYEEDDPDVPPNVLQGKDEYVFRGSKGPLHLVQFFDNKKSWQWLELDRLNLLGEDKELDAMMLSGNAKGQRFKNAKIRAECRAAYRKAIAEMETDGDADASDRGRHSISPGPHPDTNVPASAGTVTDTPSHESAERGGGVVEPSMETDDMVVTIPVTH